jgi:tripartite-type tricarboxylate transporter receptor subunit TctC
MFKRSISVAALLALSTPGQAAQSAPRYPDRPIRLVIGSAPLLPDVPSISETVTGFENFGWYSIIAPKATPVAVLEKVSAEIVKAVKEREFGDQLKVIGIDIIGGTRAQLDAFRKSGSKRMGDIVKQANLEIK